MSEIAPIIVINNDQPLRTADLRLDDTFQQADPENTLPAVLLSSATLNPRDRPHRNAQRIGIHDETGEAVGSLNLLQTAERSWINDAKIEEGRQGERLAVSAYVGVIATLHEVGRALESDPSGLSDGSLRVWESLKRRGIAKEVGAVDQHGNARFISQSPSYLE